MGHPILQASRPLAAGTVLSYFSPYAADVPVAPRVALQPPPLPRLLTCNQHSSRYGHRPVAIRRNQSANGVLKILHYNINGNWDDLHKRALLARHMQDADVDLLLLQDTRLPPGEEARMESELRAYFAGSDVFVQAFAGKPPRHYPSDAKADRSALVGGCTVIIHPTPLMTIRAITIDPGRHGILLKVILGLGPTFTVTICGVYVPCASSAPSGLEAKVTDWVQCAAAGVDGGPNHVKHITGEEWTWRLLADAAASVHASDTSLGLIAVGDFNAKLDPKDLTPTSLFLRAAGLGLITSWAQKCLRQGLSFHTFNVAHPDRATFIDHTFTTMAETALVTVGPPPGWRLETDHVPLISEFALPIFSGKRRRAACLRLPVRLVTTTEADRTTLRSHLLAGWTNYTKLQPLANLRPQVTANTALNF